MQASDDNPYVIPEMDPSLRRQIQEVNWQVVNITTPANYFHVLRRQASCSSFSRFQFFLAVMKV
jgi:2-oxoglutarate dehydrogenase E1 component